MWYVNNYFKITTTLKFPIFIVACRPGSYGQVYMRSFIESETVGEYIEEVVPHCLECPVGTYQENKGQSDCVPCPASYSTSRAGSVSVSDCKGI